MARIKSTHLKEPVNGQWGLKPLIFRQDYFFNPKWPYQPYRKCEAVQKEKQVSTAKSPPGASSAAPVEVFRCTRCTYKSLTDQVRFEI